MGDSYYERKGRSKYMERKESDPEWYQAQLKRARDYRYANPAVMARHNRAKLKYTCPWEKRIASLVNMAKYRAKKKNMEFDLDIKAVAAKVRGLGHKCQVTREKLSLAPIEGPGKNPLAPSIDRIDPTKGYTMDNIRIVCWWYNLWKADGTDEEVLNRARVVLKQRGIT